MSDSVRLDIAAAAALATEALIASRTSRENAAPTARALVAAEVDGQPGHGLARVPTYAIQSRAGKVDGFARASAERIAPAALRVDGHLGFAYPAIDLAVSQLVPLARANGIAVASIFHSHHFGQAGVHAERLAREGLIALVFGNTPKAMAFWGGRSPMLGTNPLAFAAPLPAGAAPPLVIDLALTVAARAKIVAAQKAGKRIPADWAIDRDGRPTTDPAAALAGTLLPIGGAKGGALALMIEILAAALTGSSFGWEASSMFDDKDGPPNMGHLFIALDPQRLSGGAFDPRMATLLEAIAHEPEVRLPGSRRIALRERAAREGVAIPAALHAEIRSLIATRPP
ncbi:MAG: Ldh family oxidoreductase [Steroidobacteraceae bacterium]